MADEGLAATMLLDRNDPTRLTYKEVKDGYGSCLNFFLCHGLKPWNPEDCQEALAISRAFKANDGDEDEDT
eukprot:jgi/Botrbrau1/21657/Bobra.43_1s0057.1